jgi:hypothetical protein
VVVVRLEAGVGGSVLLVYSLQAEEVSLKAREPAIAVVDVVGGIVQCCSHEPNS